MLTPLIRTRIVQSLEGASTVLPLLIERVPSDDPLWDHRFDSDRFTVREVLVHLVDYEGVWNNYVDHALSADVPVAAPPYTPDSVAAKRDYSATDPAESLRQFQAGRPVLIGKLRNLDEAA